MKDTEPQDIHRNRPTVNMEINLPLLVTLIAGFASTVITGASLYWSMEKRVTYVERDANELRLTVKELNQNQQLLIRNQDKLTILLEQHIKHP